MPPKIITRILCLLVYQFINFVSFSQNINKQSFPHFKNLKNQSLTIDKFKNWFDDITQDKNYSFKIDDVTSDDLGFKHIKINQYYNNIKIENAVYILHMKNNLIESVSGYMYTISPTIPKKPLSVEKARRKITNDQNKSIRKYNSNPVYIENKDGYLELCYEFITNNKSNTNEEKIYINTETNAVVRTINLQHFITTPTEVETNLSGKRIIYTDLTNGVYSLLDSTRGKGIETLSLKNQTTIADAKPIVDSTNNWSSLKSKLERSALDVHFGAISTYDYFLNQHNRNSIDNKGYKLTNIVHYGQNFVNAYWDGTKMIFGDGDNKIGPLVSLDIIGHEITHGLTSNTANLLLENESGALNESFSDIFGVIIDFYTRPNQANWTVAEEVSPLIRSLENPSINNDPDTYFGKNWKPIGGTDFGGIHSNNGVQNHWFYLLVNGGVGINDKNDTFNVDGIGLEKASKIVFRNLVYYLTPQSNYSDARVGSIKATEDLFGSCSKEVESVTNAWFAVGVGNKYKAFIQTDFDALYTSGCDSLDVKFLNLTQNANRFEWNFGDGTFSNEFEPTHRFNKIGNFSVKLIAFGDTICGIKDSITKVDLIQITKSELKENNLTHSTCVLPSVFKPSILLDTLSTLNWYDTNHNFITTGQTYTFNNEHDSLVIFEPNHYRIGNMNSSINTSFYNFNIRHQIFDVYQPLIIESVEVNAQTTGERLFEIRDPSGKVLQSKKINVQAGISRVNLDFRVDPGFDYQFGIGGNLIGLSRSNNGVKYPYEIPNLISIKRSNAQNAGFDFYYFFYNWDVKKVVCTNEFYRSKLTIDKKNIKSPLFDLKNSYCIGDSIHEFPTTSLNDLIGYWSPKPNNQKTTTYQFIPNPDQCATTTLFTVNINDKIKTKFDNINTTCDTINLKKLPLISSNNISGTWQLSDSNNFISTYLFTPSKEQCATTSIFSIKKNNLDTLKISNTNRALSVHIDTNLYIVKWYDCLSMKIDTLTTDNQLNYKPNKDGSYTAVITNKECEITDTLECYIYSTQRTKINEISTISISPNPFYDQINIMFKDEKHEPYFIEIKNIDGKIVMEEELNKVKLNLIDLESGVYIISLINLKKEIEFTSKVIKL